LDHVRAGDKVGKLTIVEKIKRKENSRRLYWKCVCDCEKGKEIVLSSHVIKEGNTRSCGCLRSPHGERHPNYVGYKDISGSFFNSIQRGAKIRNILFQVSIKQLWDLFEEQNKKCALSGINIQFGVNSRIKEKKREGTASLDRIDNMQGYVKENIQWLHKDINKVNYPPLKQVGLNSNIQRKS